MGTSARTAWHGRRSRWLRLISAVLAGLLALAQAPASQAQPEDCDPNALYCLERHAKSLLALGDAEIATISKPESALGEGEEKDAIDRAIRFWLQARDVGFGSGIQASLTAQRRIKMYSLTCVIAKDTSNVKTSKLTSIRVQQRALRALGYYFGPINGQLTVATRIAIRKFQNAMALVDSGELTTRQVVYLICNGAETARDAQSATSLALMYAAGKGVEKKPSYALGFLKQAEARDRDGKYFLATLSGTGWCDFPISLDRADERLSEAAAQGNPVAARLVIKYPPLADKEARWRLIKADPEFQASISVLDGECPAPPQPAPPS